MPHKPADVPLNQRLALSIAEAAALVGMNPASIRKAVRSGALRHHKPLGMDAIRIKPADLTAWLEQRDAAA